MVWVKVGSRRVRKQTHTAARSIRHRGNPRPVVRGPNDYETLRIGFGGCCSGSLPNQVFLKTGGIRKRVKVAL